MTSASSMHETVDTWNNLPLVKDIVSRRKTEISLLGTYRHYFSIMYVPCIFIQNYLDYILIECSIVPNIYLHSQV